MKKKSSEHQTVMQSGDLEELEVSVYYLSSMYKHQSIYQNRTSYQNVFIVNNDIPVIL
jgi:hypothetical protein